MTWAFSFDLQSDGRKLELSGKHYPKSQKGKTKVNYIVKRDIEVAKYKTHKRQDEEYEFHISPVTNK